MSLLFFVISCKLAACKIYLFILQAALFVTVSPDIDNISESISTLTFGSNARQVTLGQAKQNVKRAAPAENTEAWGMTDA